MKNILLSVFALLAGFSAADAQTVKVLLKPLQGTEENCSFQTAIQASSDIKGFECILNIPAGMTLAATPFTPGPALDGFDFNVKALSDNTYKFVVLSTSNSNAVIPKDALLFTTQCSIVPGFESQEYSISDLYAVMASTGQEIHASTVSQPLKINNVLPTQINVSKAPGEYATRIEIGDEFDLSITTTPDDASHAGLEWTSSDPSIATIDQSGHFTAISNGDVVISAKIGSIVGTRKFTVYKSRIYVHWEQQDTVGYVGSSVPLEAYCTSRREYDDGFSVKYSITSGNEIARIENNTLYMLKAGDCIVVASPVAPAGDNTYTIVNSPTIAKVFTVLNVPAESISLNQSEIAIGIGQSYQLTANLLPTNATAPIAWSSTDTNVAKVDQEGVVTGVAEGTAQIIAKCSDISASCLVTVYKVEPEQIVLDIYATSVMIGHQIALTATVLPDEALDKTVTWTSEDEAIATVDANGIVTGTGIGNITITATTVNGIKANCYVIVTPVPPSDIVFSNKPSSMVIGDTITVVAIVLPEDTTYPTVTWASSDTSKATVDQNGLITAISNTTSVEITATSGDISRSFSFPIYKRTQELTWDIDSVLRMGKTYPCNATTNSGIPVKYRITNGGSHAEINDNNEIVALTAGEFTVRIYNDGDEVWKALEIYREFTVASPSPTSLQLSTDYVKIEVGQDFEVYAMVTPYDCTSPVIWETSDPTIAVVYNGLIHAYSPGIATITATCEDLTATCTVDVVEAGYVSSAAGDFNPIVSVDGHFAVITGIPADIEVTIVAPNGQLVYKGKDRRINLQHHSFYICRIQNLTIKFTTK